MTKHVLLVVENVALARDHRLRKQATALLHAGLEVTVICRRDPDNAQLAGVRVLDYRAPADARGRLGFLWEYGYSWVMAAALTWRAFASRPFHLLQISGTPDIYFPIAAPFRLLGIPLVLDQRDLSPEIYTARYGTDSGLVYRALRALERRSFRAADHVLTVNDSLRRTAIGRGGVPADAVTIVGNGPHLARVAADPAPATARRATGRGSVCCWVGFMGPQDSLDLALRAVGELVRGRGRHDLRFLVIGDGEERARMERLVDELALRGNVAFLGWLAEDEVFEHLAAADVGLEPNEEPVVSPVKVMEYMAAGLPFVAFDLPESRALGGGAGLYAPPGDPAAFADAIERLLDDGERRARLGQEGRRRVREQIAWEHQEAAYLRVVRGLLQRRNRSTRSADSTGSAA